MVVREKEEQAGHRGLCISARTAGVRLPSTPCSHRERQKAEKESSHTGAFSHPSSVSVETTGCACLSWREEARTGREERQERVRETWWSKWKQGHPRCPVLTLGFVSHSFGKSISQM